MPHSRYYNQNCHRGSVVVYIKSHNLQEHTELSRRQPYIVFVIVDGTQGQQMGQMFPPGPAAAASGFYVPTMPRAYYPNNMQQIRPQPRWPSQQQVRGPAQPGGGTCL